MPLDLLSRAVPYFRTGVSQCQTTAVGTSKCSNFLAMLGEQRSGCFPHNELTAHTHPLIQLFGTTYPSARNFPKYLDVLDQMGFVGALRAEGENRHSLGISTQFAIKFVPRLYVFTRNWLNRSVRALKTNTVFVFQLDFRVNSF